MCSVKEGCTRKPNAEMALNSQSQSSPSTVMLPTSGVIDASRSGEVTMAQIADLGAGTTADETLVEEKRVMADLMYPMSNELPRRLEDARLKARSRSAPGA